MVWIAVGHLANDWPVAALWLIIPAAGVAMDLSPAEVGLLFTIFSVGSAFAFLPSGLLADTTKKRGGLLVGTFAWVVVGFALATLATEFWVLALLLAIAGMGNAAWHPIATGMVAQIDPPNRARGLGIHALGGSLAEVLAPLCAGMLLAFVSWQEALLLSIVPALFVGLCFLGVSRSFPDFETKAADTKALRTLFISWTSMEGFRLVALVSCYNAAVVALLSMIPLYLTVEKSLSLATSAVVFSFLLVLGAMLQPVIGALSDRVGTKPVSVAGNGIAAVAIGCMVLNPGLGVSIALLAFGLGALDAIRAAVLAMVVDHTKAGESTTLGLAFVLLEGVAAFGALMAGAAAGVSWGLMFFLAASFAAIATFMAARMPVSCKRTATRSG